jgi:hypothetical protein
MTERREGAELESSVVWPSLSPQSGCGWPFQRLFSLLVAFFGGSKLLLPGTALVARKVLFAH